jgi:hypothetical protein
MLIGGIILTMLTKRKGSLSTASGIAVAGDAVTLGTED